MIAWKTEGTQLYQQLPVDLYATLKECEPLREMPTDKETPSGNFKTWNQTKT